MGILFGRRRSEPVGIEFALDLTAHAVTLFERAQISGWKRFASAELDDPEFPIVIGLLRTEAEAHAGGRAPVRLWLPADQVLRRRVEIEGTTPEERLRAGFDFVARETVYRPEDVAIAVAPQARGGRTTILITFAETWHEARDYAERWGFLPGDVSTRSHATDFGVDGPVFRLEGQAVSVARPRPRFAFAAAACLALAVAGGAAGWAFYPQISALVGTADVADLTPAPQGGSEIAQAAVPAPTEEPTKPIVAEAPQAAPAAAEPVPATRAVEQTPLDPRPAPPLDTSPSFDLAAPRHVPTVPTLTPRTAPAAMPTLGPGLVTFAAYSVPTGLEGQTEPMPRPSTPPGPELPQRKASPDGAWSDLPAPDTGEEPLPRVAALDLAKEATAEVAHDGAPARLGVTDPLGDPPLPQPANRPEIGAIEADAPESAAGDDGVPGFTPPADPRPPTEGPEFARLETDGLGQAPGLAEPAEPPDATRYAAKFAPLPPPRPGAPATGESGAAAPDREGAEAPADPEPTEPAATGSDDADALAGHDATVVPDLDEARSTLPFPAPAPNRSVAADADRENANPDAPAAQDDADVLAALDVTVVPDLDQARATLPFPPAAPRQPAEISEPPTAEGPQIAEPAAQLAGLDVTVVPDLAKARATLPFPPPAPGRALLRPAEPAADPATQSSDDAEGPGLGPADSAVPAARPAHLTRAPAPAPAEPAQPATAEAAPAAPASPMAPPNTVAALLPHGSLNPNVTSNPDAPTRYASLTSPQPQTRPAVPVLPRELPSTSTLTLPKLAPGSVREAATEQGLPLDRVTLIGILDLESGRKALLRMPDGRYRSVVTGDILDGWRVSMIGVDAMRVTRSGEDRTLLLVSR